MISNLLDHVDQRFDVSEASVTGRVTEVYSYPNFTEGRQKKNTDTRMEIHLTLHLVIPGLFLLFTKTDGGHKDYITVPAKILWCSNIGTESVKYQLQIV
jgi:hypothetical protein